MDPLQLLLQLSFYAIFAAALWRFLRRPGPVELTLVGIFATTAALFTYSIVNSFAPEVGAALRPLALTLLLAQPVLVTLLVTLLRPVPRWSLALVIAAFLIATVAIVVLPPPINPVIALYVGAYFMIVEGSAAVLLLQESRRRHGVASIRLILAGVATALFGVAILIAALGSAATSAGAAGPSFTIISRLAALAAGIGYVCAFVPPRWLRDVGQRAVAFDLARRLVVGDAGTRPGVLWHNLAIAARDILGARTVTITDAQGGVVADTSVAAPPRAGRRLTRAVAPMLVDGVLHATLSVELEGHPLFVEDDIEVLNLLGLMTVRSIAREQAVLRVLEADRQLAESAAVRSSEARFRALLEAHPNAVLAVDEQGKVTWATGPIGELFGPPAEELAGVPLSALIQLDGPSLESFVTGEERHFETVGLRVDGAAFPADVAVSAFELEGERHQLILVSDASWRHEANLLRDRFLGILSHELRTPITSIYGGTQLLQRSGERLDSASRNELMAGIASESERLQRIIENLLVLARVERGADFFEPRPVAVRPVLGDLVARERTAWPELDIRLRVAGGLPLVAADEEYISLILRNLFSNAAKYAGPSSTVEVDVERSDGELHFLVRDNGPGIEPKEAEQLFGLYFRSAGDRHAQGAGIGLFVCRGLVDAMNGRIWARQRPQGGAEFGFALPLYEEADQALEEAPVEISGELTRGLESLEASGTA